MPLKSSTPEKKQPSSMRTGFLLVGFILVAGLSYFAGTLNLQVKDLLGDTAELNLSSVQDTYRALKENYDGTIDDSLLIEGANRGMVEALGDEYTIYMNQKEADAYDKSLSGDIGGGVGIEVGLREDQPTVLRVLAGNPAEEAGVKVGDVITAINGESAVDSSVDDVVTKIRGEVGTTVKLTLLRDGKELDISVTRATVTNPSVYSEIVDGIGIMTITRFDSDTGSLAREAARKFVDADVKGVVLDLRGNGGGYVSAAKEVASIWLNDKVVVTEKRGTHISEQIISGTDPILDGVSTVVLVDGNSASASEIVAGALHDHKVATLVGETTYGKGSVQQLLTLPSGATLKVTVARWYTPNDVNISKDGITPDKEVATTPEEINAGKDPQLDAAKEMLR